jgi:dienelactone hydrolase
MQTLLCAVVSVVVLVASALPAMAEVRTQVIEYKHGDVVLEGLLAWDDAVATAKTPQPGVIVCPEWWGNNDYPRGRAKQLAELGYVALAIDVYGKGKLTKDAEQAGKWAGELYGAPDVARGRAQAGLALLVQQPQVDKTRLAAIGYCMGGTIALELARTGADLDAVVAFHAGKLTAMGDAADNSKIKAVLTVCHGQDDAFVSAEELENFHAQMKAAKLDYQFLSYAGAVHAFTNPNADKAGVPGVAYHAAADRRSWEHMKLALAEAFGSGAKR